MMPGVVIIGNSGAARECHELFEDMLRTAPGLQHYYKFKGFLSWKDHVGDLKGHQHLLLGDAEDYTICSDDLFIIGIADPPLRKAVFEGIKSRGGSFMNLIHPWSYVSPTAKMGEGNILQRGSTLYCDCQIGDANYLNGITNLSHDAVIGNYNFIGPNAMFLGKARMGDENFLAVHVTLLPNAVIGNSNHIAPGSIVYKGCKNNCRLAGNPALNIGTNG